MPLTIIEINQAKTDGATLKLPDKDGLYLRVTKKTKGWRFDFRFDNRRYTISYGLYPTVSPAKARELHQEAKRQLAEGTNPAFRKRLEKLARSASFGNSFEATARHWYEGKQEQRSHAWREAHDLYLDRDLNPYIGDMPLSQVDARGLLNVLEKVRAERGVKTAERVRQTAVQVFDHGMRKQKIPANPARVLQGWADIPPQVSHEPLREDEIHEFVERLDADTGSAATKLCILLMLLTFVRKAEIAHANWDEFDLDRALWEIPAARMKMRDPHVVPLSRQAIAALEELKPLSLGSDFLFPGLSSIHKPMGLSSTVGSLQASQRDGISDGILAVV